MTRRLPRGTRFWSDVPARLDRLPWSRWHAKIVLALGITWMLDGLEVTLVGAIAPVLAQPQTLHLTEAQVGGAATAYLAGAVAGALVFGRLTDMFGRKRLFLVTLGLYTGATLLTAFSWNFISLAVFRALTGAGIGGEYSAVNSAIDELLPARLRGRTDLAVNATYWLGTALGAALTIPLLNPTLVPAAVGWRFAFLIGAILGAAIMLLRHHVPESPRWFLLHGRPDDAERVVRQIEREIAERHAARATAAGARPARVNGVGDGDAPSPAATGELEKSELEAKGNVTFASVARVLVRRHPRRTVLGLSLMVAQAFAYNGIFFTYALVLARFYGVAPKEIGLFLIPFAFGNLLGPIVLGPLFDVVGRRFMISATYLIAGVLIAITGYAMARGWLTATTQTALWCVVFFVASAAASSAYLTVSELFPVELRGMAIAFFYAVGTGAGGLVAPSLFGWLVQSGSPDRVFGGYAVGAVLMILGGLVAAVLGVPAERKSLEQIAELDR
jgi:MFS family permease